MRPFVAAFYFFTPHPSPQRLEVSFMVDVGLACAYACVGVLAHSARLPSRHSLQNKPHRVTISRVHRGCSLLAAYVCRYYSVCAVHERW